ncbi:uncharacterized protein LOC132307150 isoform X2 [Cornus florida]|uniref:uncharacterized protein LOC132307150 isoform X2 n=1 Tax=Cornus florida TaxID=4283 RepID=UPI0028A1F982|nr:uncharacterized protein LOC132307150 isoform X2 [Cornus florida]
MENRLLPQASQGNHHKQQVGRKTTVNKEVVKYISTLPNYLERGENLQEKAFNVGVLDWRRLENWQHNLKQVPDRCSKDSPSSSNTTSFFSTDGSSIHSSRGHSCSPAHPRMHQPTLQSHLNASPEEGCSQGVKTFTDVGTIQDLKAASSDPLKGKQSILRICHSIDEKHSEIKLKECKSSDPQIVPKTRMSLDSEIFRVAPHLKGKMKIQEVKSTGGMEKLPEPYYDIIDHNCPGTDNSVVLCLPRDDKENSHSATSCFSDSTAINSQKSSEANQRSFQEVSFSEEVYNAEVYHDIPCSCPMPCEGGDNKNLKMKQANSTDVKSVKCSHKPSQPSLSSVRLSSSPSRGKNLEEKSSKIMSTDSTLIKSSEESDLKMGTVAAAKSRKPSPTRLFSIGLGRNGRSSGHRDGSAISQLSSRHISAKSDSEKAVAPRSDNSNSHLQNGSSTARSCPLRLSSSPSRGKNLEEKSSKIMSTNSTLVKSSAESDLKMGTVAAAKVRNPSPTRLFSIGMGKNVSSRNISAKSGLEKAVAPPCSDNSNNDMQNGSSKARSSPLRRLLDPLLKAKATNSHDSTQSSRKDSSSADRACNSSHGRGESSTLHSMKVKFDLRSCRSINVDDSRHNDKHGSSTVQALLQIAIKNGHPLFTFAVDNNGNILAATMRKLSTSKKDDDSWIYTFFTIREMKKKNGCINQGSKGKGQGYVPNVVAQLKVTDSQFSKLIGHKCTEQFSIREFVLFAVDPRESDQQTSDFQPNDELAAIIVKFPEQTAKNLDQDGQQSDSFSYQSMIGLKEPLSEVRSNSNSRDDKENGSSNGSQDLFSTTVLLPGGIHGLPSKGEPSSLIERWKSGGLCDCGGWDMGCRIRVLSNQIRLSRRSSSSIVHPTEGLFELFSQGEPLENRPAFSLSAFKDGLFSVEFNSSLSLLQAFSICIAVLNSRKAYRFPESSNLFEEKSSEETTFSEIDGTKGS